MKPRAGLLDRGTVDYAEALGLQEAMFEELVAGKNAAADSEEVAAPGGKNGSAGVAAEVTVLGGKNGPAGVAAEVAVPGGKNGSVGVAAEVAAAANSERPGGNARSRTTAPERAAVGGNARSRPTAPETAPSAGWLIFCEHPHVYTLGRSGRAENLLVSEDALKAAGVELHRTGRGGDITYHGPGQIVCYPILDLERVGLSLRGYIEALEEAVIETLARFGIEAGRVPGKTGVWVGTGATEKTSFSSTMAENAVCDGAKREAETNETLFSSVRRRCRADRSFKSVGFPAASEYRAVRSRAERCTDSTEKQGSAASAPQSRKPERKICAIGVRASRGVVMHGFALNVATDLAWFEKINPCGMAGSAVSSMERETGRKIAPDEVKKLLRERLEEHLGLIII